jgi:hypothetical protein
MRRVYRPRMLELRARLALSGFSVERSTLTPMLVLPMLIGTHLSARPVMRLDTCGEPLRSVLRANEISASSFSKGECATARPSPRVWPSRDHWPSTLVPPFSRVPASSVAMGASAQAVVAKARVPMAASWRVKFLCGGMVFSRGAGRLQLPIVNKNGKVLAKSAWQAVPDRYRPKRRQL